MKQIGLGAARALYIKETTVESAVASLTRCTPTVLPRHCFQIAAEK